MRDSPTKLSIAKNPIRDPQTFLHYVMAITKGFGVAICNLPLAKMHLSDAAASLSIFNDKSISENLNFKFADSRKRCCMKAKYVAVILRQKYK